MLNLVSMSKTVKSMNVQTHLCKIYIVQKYGFCVDTCTHSSLKSTFCLVPKSTFSRFKFVSQTKNKFLLASLDVPVQLYLKQSYANPLVIYEIKVVIVT